MSSSAIPVTSLNVRVRRIDGSLVVTPMNREDSEQVALVGVGELIWNLADGTRTTVEIASAIANEFDVEFAEVAGDTEEFVRELVARRLMHWKARRP